MKYLIKFNEDGRRGETYVVEEKTTEQVQALLDDGFEIIEEDIYQLLLGNVDGQEHIKNPQTGEFEIYVPPEPSLEELKTAKLQEVDSFIASKITGGFVSLASGEPVTYDSDKDTQLTMQGIALNVQTPLFAEKYPTGCPVRGYSQGSTVKQVYMLTAEQVMAWCADLSMHIGMCKQRGWKLQAQVNACTTKEELEAIVW